MSKIPGPAAGSHSTQLQAGTTSQPGQTTTAQDQPQTVVRPSQSQGSYYDANKLYSSGVYNPSVPSTTNMSPGGSVMGGGSPNYYNPGPVVVQPPAYGYGTGYGGQRYQRNNRGSWASCVVVFIVFIVFVGIFFGIYFAIYSSSTSSYHGSSSGSGGSNWHRESSGSGFRDHENWHGHEWNPPPGFDSNPPAGFHG